MKKRLPAYGACQTDIQVLAVIGRHPSLMAKYYHSVSQTVVRGPQVVLGLCPCGPFRLNISPKKTEKIKIT